MKKIVITIILVIIVLALAFTIVFFQNSEDDTLEIDYDSPESIFNGAYDTIEESAHVLNFSSGTEIFISFNNEDFYYDEKNLHLTNDGNKYNRNFNCYYIKESGDTLNDDSQIIWYLCKYTPEKELILLNENNESAGRIFYVLSEKNIFGKRDIEYYWDNGDEVVPIYKGSNSWFRTGTSYLKSKYCSGVLE